MVYLLLLRFDCVQKIMLYVMKVVSISKLCRKKQHNQTFYEKWHRLSITTNKDVCLGMKYHPCLVRSKQCLQINAIEGTRNVETMIKGTSLVVIFENIFTSHCDSETGIMVV